MRVIHEVGTDPTSMVSVHPYARMRNTPPSWKGGRAEIVMFLGQDGEEDCGKLEIEGDCSQIRALLQDALEALDSMEEFHTKQVEEEFLHSTQCSHCGAFYDTRLPIAWGHPDGHGFQCLGDGTMVVSEQNLRGRGSAGATEFKDLQAGEVFRVHRFGDSEAEAESQPDFVAIEAPSSYFDGNFCYSGVRVERNAQELEAAAAKVHPVPGLGVTAVTPTVDDDDFE